MVLTFSSAIMQNVNDIWYYYLLPFIVPAITGLIVWIRKEGKNEAASGLTAFEVEGIKEDIKEMKKDIENVEDRSQDALRQLDIINLRLKNIEDYHERHSRRGNGAV